MSEPHPHSALAATTAATAVSAAYPYLGLGAQVKNLLDGAATAAIATRLTLAQLHGHSPVIVAGCEGARDGAPTLALPAVEDAHAVHLYCDPIDGTLNAVRGGPRVVSVVAFGRAVADAPAFDDAQSIFAVGSHRWDVSGIFDTGTPGVGFDLVADHLHSQDLQTATLNRDDNRALLLDLAGPYAAPMVIGSRSGYRPTIAGPGWTAVGDTTVTLPFECDLEFGRIGLVEAQIQSALYPSWSGLVVSRDSIRAHPGGLRGYLTAYLQARGRGDLIALRGLFSAGELAWFDQHAMAIEAVTHTLHPDRFGVGAQAVIAISALTTLHDPVTGFEPGVLDPPVWHSGAGCLEVDTLTVTAGCRDRRRVPITPADTAGLSEQIRAWYRTLHWADVTGAEALAACAEGRLIHAHSVIEGGTW